MLSVEEIGKKAKNAVPALAKLRSGEKNEALNAVAKSLIDGTKQILEANEKDVISARERGMKEGLVDRLMLNEKRTAPDCIFR